MADAEGIARLSGQLGYPSTEAEVRSRLEFLIDDLDHEVFVALDGPLIGWIGVVNARSLTSDAHAKLLGLVVDEEWRSQGIGVQLLGAAEDWARSRGLIHLTVSTNTVRADAHRFYERQGYVQVKEQRLYIRNL